MRRVLAISRVAAVYLLLGFVATWAVAWGLAFHTPRAGHPDYESPHDYEVAGNAVYTSGRLGWGSIRLVFLAYNHIPDQWDRWDSYPEIGTGDWVEGRHWLSESFVADLSGFDGWGMKRRALTEGLGSDWEVGVDDARGLPFLSHWCSWKVDSRGSVFGFRWIRASPMMIEDSLVGGLPLPDNKGPKVGVDGRLRALPYYPIWSGLALNTAFYALVFFVVVRTLRSFRRGRRFARGLCPRCRYDREFDYRLPCPECGDAPRAKRRERSVGAADSA